MALSTALHNRGMALMVDVVVNHFGSAANVDFSQYTPFNNGSYFHSEAFISNYNNQTDVEQGWLGDSNVPLPDVNTELSGVVNTFNSWISSLVQTYNIDGLRIDTAKHVRQDFWPGFISSANVFALGEVLSGDPAYLSSYQPYLGGVLDYATYYPLLRAFSSGGNMAELASLTTSSYRAQFTDMQLLGTFMENHDQPRFTNSTSNDVTVVRNAMAYTLLSDGIPIIYYGQEQSFSGGDDPYNREALWPSQYVNTTLYNYLALLNAARNLAWSAGFGSNLTTSLYADMTATVSQKGPLLLVLSNQGSTSAPRSLSFSTQFASGTVLANILTCTCITIGKSTTNTTIINGAPQVFLPLALAQQICPNIVAPTQTSSFMSKVTSLFTSSSKAASKAAGRPVFATVTPATTSSSLALSRSSPPISTTSQAPKTTTIPSSSSSSTTTMVTQAQGRPVLKAPTTTTFSTSTSTSSNKATTTPAAGRPVLAGPSTTSSTTTSKATTTPVAGRPVLAGLKTSPVVQQKRHVSPQMNHHSPAIVPNQGATVANSNQGQKRHLPRQATAPPASLSQYYREERKTPSNVVGPYGLSSKYSYSSSHLPASGARLNAQSRSNSDNDLARRGHELEHKLGHTQQSRSMHSLKKQSSSHSLSGQAGRTQSFGGSIPPIPPIPQKLDSRTALMSDNAPYAHTFSLSSTSLALPTSSHTPRSRRSSIGSVRSFRTSHSIDPAMRRRNASQERLGLLAQENGVPAMYSKSGIVDNGAQSRANEVMGNPSYGASKSSLYSPSARGDRSVSGSPQPKSPNPHGLPNIRRHDHRAHTQHEIRQFHL